MSTIAVMQPYLFPYIGYFQLIKAVDKFVFYDDVNFIKNGWINRNRILINGEPKYFTIPCKGASSHEKIKNIEHGLDSRKRKKIMKKLKFTYSRAPFFDEVFDILNQVLEQETKYISELAAISVEKSSRYLGLDCTFVKSSVTYCNTNLDAADRLIDICKQEGADYYINAIGGQELYSKDYFREQGVKLQFLQPKPQEYRQFGDEFVPWLSIIDMMMFNSPMKVKYELLKSYTLI